MTHAIRVLVVDDHLVVRKGIRALLATEPDIVVVGEAEDGERAIAEAIRLRPDVILMDLVMPRMDGIAAIQQIHTLQPTAHILVLTSFAADEQIFPAIRAGAQGYILKDTGVDELVKAIHQLYQGGASLHPVIARKVLAELVHMAPPPLPAAAPAPTRDPLTERELEVLGLVAHGASNQEIATALVISEATVRKHVSSILSKLHLASRTQAALYALRQGLTSLPDESENK